MGLEDLRGFMGEGAVLVDMRGMFDGERGKNE